jgi:ATP/maltotriose-dependent transcriptional regulator MalT
MGRGYAAAGAAHRDSYLVDHVLAARDPDERVMLAAVSLLPRIDVRALEMMGFDASAAATLDQLHRAHSFVARLDRQPSSWRLHDLLREALRSHFDSFRDAEWRRVAFPAFPGPPGPFLTFMRRHPRLAMRTYISI